MTDEDQRLATMAQADYLLRAALDLLCAVMPECLAHSIVDQICEDHSAKRLAEDIAAPIGSASTSTAKH